MSLIDAPLALIDRLIARRAPSVQPDDPIARLVARTTAQLRPNPAYQRRLRGRVMNQYVAMREGLMPVPVGTAQREMGRIGRSVLYASFGLALSATAVAAASTQSLPGDTLYPVKLQIEQVRINIAPASVKPALAAAALDERLSEVEELATAGRWSLVPLAAKGASDAEATLIAMGGTPSKQAAQGLARHKQVLAMLLAAAPPSARSGLALALAASDPAVTGHANGNGSGAINGNAGGNDNDLARGHQGNGTPGGTGGNGGGGASASSAPGEPSPSDQPTPQPTHSPQPHPSHSDHPSASPKPSPS
jgi:hypothetical protein